MTSANPYGWAGWFVLDARLLVFVLVVSAALTVGTIALFFRGRGRSEIAGVGLGLYVFIVAVLIVFFNHLAGYPVFRVESIFPFP